MLPPLRIPVWGEEQCCESKGCHRLSLWAMSPAANTPVLRYVVVFFVQQQQQQQRVERRSWLVPSGPESPSRRSGSFIPDRWPTDQAGSIWASISRSRGTAPGIDMKGKIWLERHARGRSASHRCVVLLFEFTSMMMHRFKKKKLI